MTASASSMDKSVAFAAKNGPATRAVSSTTIPGQISSGDGKSSSSASSRVGNHDTTGPAQGMSDSSTGPRGVSGPNPSGYNKSSDFLDHPGDKRGRPKYAMETREAHNTKYHQPTLDGPETNGFFSRSENLEPKRPSSKMILSHYPAATPELSRWNYMKPQQYEPETNYQLNYHPTSDMRQTRFHRGFQRKHHTDIRQDAARLEKEYQIQHGRDQRDAQVQESWSNYKQDYQFNILNGEGKGRDHEFKSIGKRIVNPCHDHNIYDEHDKDQRNRTKQSANRFYEYPAPKPSAYRASQLTSEGFLESKKETMIIGYGEGAPRCKLSSQGVSDQFQHLRDGTQERQWDRVKDRNASQIVFG